MKSFRVLLSILLLAAGARAASALEYRLVAVDDGRCGFRGDCAAVVAATGEIGLDERDRFRSFVSALDGRAAAPQAFVIQSPGGNLAGAIQLGMALRQIGVPVVAGRVVSGGIGRGFCGSACVYVLMGGRSRRVSSGSVIAIHAPRRAASTWQGGVVDDGTPEGRRMVAQLLSEYSRLMGVDPALIALTMRTPHEGRRVLSSAEIRRYGLATSVARRR